MSDERSPVDACGFSLFPSWGLLPGWDESKQTEIEAEDIRNRRTIKAVLEKFELAKRVPECARIEVNVIANVPANVSLSEAHGTWEAQYFGQVATPVGFVRRPDGTETIDGLWRVEVRCIKEEANPRSNWHGFEGYFVSLLIDVLNQAIWDARGEEA